ncbi:MAG: aminopeptidase P family protein [Deltaproteobacteria bacterium]|nr:MAG: aminopeptidase P family protein [Deltaproteobacteria bacterium]
MEPAPVTEVTGRVAALQGELARKEVSLALIRQAADLYYYTGVLADGWLAVSPSHSPLLLVRRPQRRLLEAAPPWPLAFYGDLKEIPELLNTFGFAVQGPLGLELDVMPVGVARRLQKIFPQMSQQDISPLIRQQRMLKSAYEITQMRRAAAILDQALEDTPRLLKPGVTEMEVAAALEYRLRLLGHQGLVRVRTWNLELFYGHVLSGVSGVEAAYTDTPSGGPGFTAAFPQGAGLKKLAFGEPISIDLFSCVNGYVVDQTRMYALESLPERAWEAFRIIEDLYRLFEELAHPGVQPGDIFQRLWQEVKDRGWGDYFMGRGADRVSFLGHGLGLEADEYPLLTARFPYPLATDMVLAFEPKFFLPEIGMVGLEDTGRITPEGVEWLTTTPREVMVIKR